MARHWTHKVVKHARGIDGRFFAHRAAATFDSFEAADEYAARFAAQQHAALGDHAGLLYRVTPRRAGDKRVEYSIRDGVRRSREYTV